MACPRLSRVDRVEYAVQLTEVCRSFGRLRALESISLEVPAASSTALMGPNGAGKTTLLKLCATLITPTSGTLRIVGFDPQRDGPLVRARIAVLGHESHLYGDLSAVENLSFTARLHGIDDAAPRIEAAIERIGLRGAARRPVRTFSRGMQQRCALARVLLQQPQLLLLDEPATGLDAAAREILYAIVNELRAGGTTVMITSHDVGEAVALCDRALILADGRVVWSGAIDGASPAAARAGLENRLRAAAGGG
jgi:heme ABC exporter ATP-binding subunit CcmA